MLNTYPLWKYLLLVVLIAVGALFAAPNLYGEDPALQVSSSRGAEINEAIRDEALLSLRTAGIEPKAVEMADERLLLRFSDEEQQLQAAEHVKRALGPQFVVAFNLAPSTPKWLQALNAAPMYLGLDLRGGVHFLMEVDMDAAVTQAYERYADGIRGQLREEKVRYLAIAVQPGQVAVRFRSAEEMAAARAVIERENPSLMVTEQPEGSEPALLLTVGEQERKEIQRFALEQNITTLRNRVNELGVAEPVIQQQGANRIVVQLPGVQDTARAKEILGATATLEFRPVAEKADPVEAQRKGRAPAGTRLYFDRQGRPTLLQKRVILTGEYITHAASGIDQQGGGSSVSITLDGKGGTLMNKFTRDNVGKMMAVVFIENKVETQIVAGEEKKVHRKVEEVINQAVIRDQFASRFQITGLDSPREARDLALLLRAGSLAAPIEIVEERTVGPSLGKENIQQGFQSVVIGFAIVLIFMAAYYRLFGIVADVALGANLVLMVAVLSLFQATLTLPGIAGIVLTVGMAVDANVLIFERIREEIALGNSPQAAIHAGYEKAFSTIADANITTLIAALVLFSFGTGPIKGFAVTLSIGIVTSMFTAIMGTRALINLIYGGKRVQKLAI